MSQTAFEAGGTANLSTTIDPNTVPLESGGGRPGYALPARSRASAEAGEARPGSAEARLHQGELRQGEPDLSKPDPQSTDLGKDGDKGKDGPKKPVSVRETLDTENARLKAEEAAQAAKDEAVRAKAAEGKEPAKETDRTDKTRALGGQEPSESAGRKPGSAEAKLRQGEPGYALARLRQGELRQGEHAQPPARFLPEARTKWANVPNEVKAEVHRLSQEYEGEIDKHRQAAERYQSVRRFDDIARANGRELKDTLNRIVAVEQALARSPIAGLEMILREVGPRKADGSHLSLHEIAQAVARQSPQQFAQALQNAVQHPAPQGGRSGQQQSPDSPWRSSPWRSLASAEPGVRAMAEELRSMRIELAASRLEPMLNAFAAAHPDYHALEERIAGVLTSGVVDKLYGTGLTPEQRLLEAYRMAGGTASPSRSEPPAPSSHSSALPAPSRSLASAEAGDTAPPVHPEAGKKSIRGAPNGGEDTVAERPKQSIRDLLRSEMRSIAGG